jgi:Domain of unknown function (DUF4386)
MDADRWDRLAPLYGLAFVLLAIVGNVIARKGEPGDFPGEAGDIVQHYMDHKSAIMAGSWIALIAALFLFAFVAALWSRLRGAEGRAGRTSATAFAGGTGAATIAVVSHAAYLMPALRADEEDVVEPAYATALYDLSQALHGMALPIAFAVLIGAAGMVAIRSGMFPRWFGIVSLVIAVLLTILPISWFMMLFAVIWVLVVSIWLFRGTGTAGAPPAGATPAETGRTSPA